MMIHSWRITKGKHAKTAFSGAGAKTYGGRWNSPRTAMVYTAGSASLAILEMLVHLSAPDLMRRYVLFEVAFDESLVANIVRGALPAVWRRSPTNQAIRQIGDNWIAANRSAVLRVPSVLVASEWNYLLNPAHPDFAKITIGPRQPIMFDPRLVKKSS